MPRRSRADGRACVHRTLATSAAPVAATAHRRAVPAGCPGRGRACGGNGTSLGGPGGPPGGVGADGGGNDTSAGGSAGPPGGVGVSGGGDGASGRDGNSACGACGTDGTAGTGGRDGGVDDSSTRRVRSTGSGGGTPGTAVADVGGTVLSARQRDPWIGAPLRRRRGPGRTCAGPCAGTFLSAGAAGAPSDGVESGVDGIGGGVDEGGSCGTSMPTRSRKSDTVFCIESGRAPAAASPPVVATATANVAATSSARRSRRARVPPSTVEVGVESLRRARTSSRNRVARSPRGSGAGSRP